MSDHLRAALVLSLVISACRSNTSESDPLAKDTTIARELGMAMTDSLDEPVMTDLVGGGQTSGAGGGAPPDPSVDPGGSQTSAGTSTAARSAADRGSPSPSSQPAGSRTAGSRTAAAPATSGGRVSPSGGTLQRATGSRQDSVSREQASAVLPRTPTGTATPTTSAPRTATPGRSSSPIAAGTNLTLTSDATICTNTHKVGQRFAAAVTHGVQASDGSTIAPGSRAVVEITQLQRSGKAGEPIAMGFRVTSVASGGRVYAVNAPARSASIARVRSRSGTSDATKVAAGAAVGAAVGQVVGKDAKSTVAGAAVGAVVGAAAAKASANYEGCVPAGGRIHATVTD